MPSTRNPTAAAGAFFAGAGIAALTIGLAWGAAIPTIAKVITIGLGVGFALGFGLMSLRLVTPRGGLVIDEAGGRVGLGVTSRRDTWWLDSDDVIGIRVLPDTLGEPLVDLWIAVLILRERPAVVLARSPDRSTTILVARRLAEEAGLRDLDAEADGEPELEIPPLAEEGRVTVAVRRGAALQGTLFFFGMSLMVAGGGMMSQVADKPVFGFLFGPLLALLGVALLGITIVKRYGREELTYDGSAFTHGWRMGRLRWGVRTVRSMRPTWRFFVHGLRGAHLELVGDDGILIIGGGATARSRAGLADLAAIPGRFRGGG